MRSKGIKNTILSVLIAVILLFGVMASILFTDKLYAYLLSLSVLLILGLYFLLFERRRLASRYMVIISVMVALAVVGRFIPVFKPVTAVTVIAGLYLGAEAGFMVGALSAVISNFYFGQGPWSLFQMLAWGLCGLLAGCFAEQIKKNRLSLGFFGIITGVAYSMIMDVWTVLWAYNTFEIYAYLVALSTALPFTASYIFADVIYLQVLNKPLGKKLERIKKKYL